MTEQPRFFQIEKDGPVIIWRFDNPPKNLWTTETGMEFANLESEFYADPDLRVGIFTSAMPDVFIQHFDVLILVNMGENLAKQAAQAPPPQRRIGFRRDSKPIIAAINANLAGGGLERVMSFDFRFMSRTARAAQGEVNVGILPGGGGTQRMPRLIGIAKSLELQLLGRAVFADEAERIGLITRACDPERLMPEALAFARELATRPPLAVHHIRQCIFEGIDMPLEDGLAMESELFRELLQSGEAMERMRAYVATGQNARRILDEEEDTDQDKNSQAQS
ncbi:MAG TPA: enoyl-CoA hydratase/isomerase family protein [Dehalococcoidales bacterium]|nr:enoyl-CoA hydratase/isomerase family protein [Dehalococcoidales bacterium]